MKTPMGETDRVTHSVTITITITSESETSMNDARLCLMEEAGAIEKNREASDSSFVLEWKSGR